MHVSRIKQRLGAIAAVAVMATAGAAAPASADRDGVCHDGDLCYYSRDGWGGGIADFSTNWSVNSYWAERFRYPDGQTGSRLLENMRSVWNRSPYVVAMYSGKNYTGESYTLYPYQYYAQIPNLYKSVQSHAITGS